MLVGVAGRPCEGRRGQDCPGPDTAGSSQPRPIPPRARLSPAATQGAPQGKRVYERAKHCTGREGGKKSESKKQPCRHRGERRGRGRTRSRRWSRASSAVPGVGHGGDIHTTACGGPRIGAGGYLPKGLQIMEATTLEQVYPEGLQPVEGPTLGQGEV